MPAVIIADASCLILLEKIQALHMLQQLFGHVVVTDIVAEEFGLPLPEWVSIQVPQDGRRQQLLALTLDRGEASAIALALEQANSLLIVDDSQGRRVAQQLHLTITGTLGVIVQAKQSGHITAVRPFLDAIAATNFRMSEQLVQLVLKQAGE